MPELRSEGHRLRWLPVPGVPVARRRGGHRSGLYAVPAPRRGAPTGGCDRWDGRPPSHALTEHRVRVRFLGTAAGGGLPQWNCACTGCTLARRTGVGRTQDCLAITGDGSAWYLVNASPDLRTQLVHAPELAPGPGLRDTPLRGVLFTSAELDHTLGVLTLREAASLDIYATAPVRSALEGPFPVGPILSGYTTVEWHEVVPGQPVALDGGLTVTVVTLGAKRPRYAAGLPGEDWVVAYRFVDPATGGVFGYAPCLAQWSDAFASVIEGADAVVLDGTFMYD
ncbi:MAG: hypothetical protein E6G35_12830, partial [Actinobacteria bacterium]